jgi:hypothetical protein
MTMLQYIQEPLTNEIKTAVEHIEVSSILILLNELNKVILCEASILFYSTSSINLVLDLHEYNILFITYPE